MSAKPRAARYEKWRLRATVAWAIVGAALVFLLAVCGLAVVGQAVELLLVGTIVGYVCSPLTNFLEDRRVPRGVAALVSLVVVVAAIAVVVALFMGPFLREFVTLLRNVPSYFTQAQSALEAFWDTFGSASGGNVANAVNSFVSVLVDAGTQVASDLARQLSTGLVTSITDLAGHLVTIFLALILAYWFALDYPKIMREFAVIAGPDYDDELVLSLAVLSRSVGGYMRGTLITSLANGVMVAAGLALIGHPYAGLLGIATFVLHFVPVVGPMLSSLSAVLLALFVGPLCALWTLAITVVAQNVTDNVLSPLVMRSAVKIHPALSLVGIVVGGAVGGAVGMVLAVPLTAAIKGLFVYYFESRTSRQLVSPDGALFGGTPYSAPAGGPMPTFDALDDDTFIERSRLLAGLSRLHAEREAATAPDEATRDARGDAPSERGDGSPE